MASALFKLSSDGGSNYLAAGTAMADANALAYVSSSTYSMKAALDSTSGVSSVAWTITSADDAHAASLPTVTTAADKTCTFVVPKTGGAWLLRCTVNGGVNAQGNADTSLVRSLAIKVLNANGQQEVAVGETSEAGTYGWTKAINDVGRTAGSSITEGALRTAAAALTASLAVNSQKITGLAAPSASADAATKAYVDGLDALVGAGIFGDGSDGNATISGTTTLARDTYYNNLTIASTGRLSTAGFRVFVKGTLTVDSGGTLDARGGTTAAPFNTAAGKGDSTAADPALNVPQGGNSTGNGSVYGAAGKGGNGGSHLSSTGSAGTASSNAVGGKGGAGGAGVGSGFGAGGTAGALTAPTYQPSFAFPECLLATFQSLGTPPGTPTALRGGSGGGGGGYGGSYTGGQNATFGGGGGCGGGVLMVAARIVINNGTINADGAAGGAGGGNAVDAKYGGGGGGGGGGYAVCVYRSWTGAAPTANGGAGGAAGGGAAVAGSAGAAGKVLALQI